MNDRPLAGPAVPADVYEDAASAWQSEHPLAAGAAISSEMSTPARPLRTNLSSFNIVAAGYVGVELEERIGG